MTCVYKNRPIYLIINPRSGYGGHKRLLGDLRAAIEAEGMALEEYTTQAPADATRFCRTIVDKAGAVVVWGGDGTMSEVAAGLAGSKVPILPCPAGTENLLAKELRIPSKPNRVAEILKSGQVVECDIGNINGKSFLLIVGIGFDGEVVRRLASVRTGHISHLSYFWPIWRTFWGHEFPKIKVVADGEEIFNDFGLVFIGNISRYAVGLRICHEAKFDDGKLDMVIFSCREQTHLILHAAWTLLRAHPLQGTAIYRQFKHATIETDEPVASQFDGDPGPNTPLEVSVSPDRIKLIVPVSRDRWKYWPWKKK